MSCPQAVGRADRQRSSVIVAVPARDEQVLLGRCLDAVAAAADRVRPHADVHIVVAADDCTDDTEAVAAAALSRHHAAIVRLEARNVGAARAAAVAAGLTAIGPASDGAWIAMTDADSVVPVDWLAAHLHAADSGFDALVGAIAVDHWSHRQRALDAGLSRHRDAQRRAGIRPVHGANLGVSAAALAAVGGVPVHALSEDAALVRRLDAAGRAVLYDHELVVRTSARRSARAPGGFSTLLDDLEQLEQVSA